MKRMKIAVYADSYDGKVGQGINYMHFMQQFGELVLVTPNNDLEDIITGCDILFIPGGADVDPRRYGEQMSFICGRPNHNYEYLDERLLDPWLKTDKPIIGICRGLQALNVAAGGTLWQHMEHHTGGEDRTELGHRIFTDVKDWEIINVNSYHHQGIRVLAPGLKDIGWAPIGKNSSIGAGSHQYYKPRWIIDEKTGEVKKSKHESPMVVEVIQHVSKPWFAVQYHPEDFNCPFAIMMIEQTIQRYKPGFKIHPNEYKQEGLAGGYTTYKEKKIFAS